MDKFNAFRLTQASLSNVKAPLGEQCYASLQCRVVAGKIAVRYNLFIFEVPKAWIDLSRSKPRAIHHPDGETFRWRARRSSCPQK
jgi:flavin reductase (DIM6/NTAB) family NADH-FMN oxidoreductase RutF